MVDVLMLTTSGMNHNFRDNVSSLAEALGIKNTLSYVGMSFFFPCNKMTWQLMLNGDDDKVTMFKQKVRSLGVWGME
jgi:hypothetical protein